MRVVKMGYLQKVKGSFRVRIVVPPELQSHLPPPYTGKGNLIKGLGTGNEREANRLAVPIIADFLGIIEQAKREAAPMEWQYYTTRDSFGVRIARRLAPVGETIEPPPVVEPAPVTINGDPVTFELMVGLWATEKKISDPSKRPLS